MNSQLIGPAGRAFVERFAKFTCRDNASLIHAVEQYNRDFSAYGNEVYAHQETRVAHWANFLDQGWFQRRLDLPLLRAPQFEVVLDLGFSTPYAFAFPHLREQKTTLFIYADREKSCEVFFHELTRMEGWQKAAKRSRLTLVDLENENDRKSLTSIIRKLRPKSLLVVASEVLEHLTHTQPVCRWLREDLANSATRRTAIYLTLPIGARIPSHRMEVKSSEEAAEWVSRYFPQHEGCIMTNPGKPKTRYLKAAYCAWTEIAPR
jgi:hypothetical protein